MKLFDQVSVGGAHRSSRNVIVGFIKPASATRFLDRYSRRCPAGTTTLVTIPRLSVIAFLKG